MNNEDLEIMLTAYNEGYTNALIYMSQLLKKYSQLYQEQEIVSCFIELLGSDIANMLDANNEH